MTKSEAAAILANGKHSKAAEILGITKGAFSMWPNELQQSQVDRVIGAAVRTGIPIPARYLAQSGEAA